MWKPKYQLFPQTKTQHKKSTIFGMAAMPVLCRGVCFSPKLSYHTNVSLVVYLPVFYFSYIINKHLQSFLKNQIKERESKEEGKGIRGKIRIHICRQSPVKSPDIKH